MPLVNWGVRARDIEGFDRDAQFKPYTGTLPVNGMYKFRIKQLKYIAGTDEKFPQLRASLELVPRNAQEKKYKGYFITAFMVVSDKTAFQYVPFLDAIGVSGAEFERKTLTDQEGNVRKIGAWRNSGEEMILAEIRSNTGENAEKYPKQIGWMEAVTESDDEEDSEDYDDEDDSEDFDDEWDDDE